MEINKHKVYVPCTFLQVRLRDGKEEGMDWNFYAVFTFLFFHFRCYSSVCYMHGYRGR